MMKKLGAFAFVFLLGGCTSSLQSGGSPPMRGETTLPVIYPYRERAGGRTDSWADPLVERFGPSWDNLEGEYPEYRFN